MNTSENYLDKYRVIFVLGAPGSGKNTQCDKMLERYNLVHFSCGDLLREAALKDDEDGKLINYYIKEGLIVPVRITCNLAKKAMEKAGGTKNTYIIDGYPRNKENLDGWLEVFEDKCKILAVLFFEATQEECAHRIKLRSQSSGRIDDNDESLSKRFKVFIGETVPNLQNLSKVTEIVRIDANGAPDAIFKDVIKEFDRILQ